MPLARVATDDSSPGGIQFIAPIGAVRRFAVILTKPANKKVFVFNPVRVCEGFSV